MVASAPPASTPQGRRRPRETALPAPSPGKPPAPPRPDAGPGLSPRGPPEGAGAQPGAAWPGGTHLVQGLGTPGPHPDQCDPRDRRRPRAGGWGKGGGVSRARDELPQPTLLPPPLGTLTWDQEPPRTPPPGALTCRGRHTLGPTCPHGGVRDPCMGQAFCGPHSRPPGSSLLRWSLPAEVTVPAQGTFPWGPRDPAGPLLSSREGSWRSPPPAPRLAPPPPPSVEAGELWGPNAPRCRQTGSSPENPMSSWFPSQRLGQQTRTETRTEPQVLQQQTRRERSHDLARPAVLR